MKSRDIPYVLFTALAAIGVAATGWLHPLNNWDLIGYIASAFANSSLGGAELHEATYAELRRAVPAARFDLLTTNGPYARGVFADPAALEQQLPFYRIRVLYILALQALAPLARGLAGATYLVSAASAAGLTLLTGLMLRRSAPQIPWPIAALILVLALYLGAVLNVARLSTPDALFSLAALASLALFHHRRIASLVILALLPLIRTDAVVLSALILILLLIERDRNPWHYLLVVVSGSLYIWVNMAHGNYGHAVLFNFSLIPGQRTPYPASLEALRDPGPYFEVYLRGAAGMVTRWVPWVLLAAIACAALERKRAGRIGSLGRLAMVAVGYVVLHFLAFPLGVARHYSFGLILCCIYVAQAVAVFVQKSKV